MSPANRTSTYVNGNAMTKHYFMKIAQKQSITPSNKWRRETHAQFRATVIPPARPQF